MGFFGNWRRYISNILVIAVYDLFLAFEVINQERIFNKIWKMGNRHKLSKDLISSPPLEFSKSTWCQGENTNIENKEHKRT